MNRIELYQKTRKTLLDAYRNGELKHGDCGACAVGNICNNNTAWSRHFVTSFCGDKIYCQDIFDMIPNQSAEDLIKSTGYTQKELMKIEYAFESSLGRDYFDLSETKKGQYIGLQAVFKVLDEIHEVDLPSSQEVQRELDSIAIGFGIEVLALS